MNHCVICDLKQEGLFSTATETSLNGIKNYSERWAKIGKNIDIFERVSQLQWDDTVKYHYHRKCYQSICHKRNIENAESKYEADLKSAVDKKKRGRKRHSSSEPSLNKKRKLYDPELCVFCQNNTSAKLFQVRSDSMGNKFLQIKEMSKDENIRARLSLLCDAMDAFAQNMKYHVNCLRKETKHIESFEASNSCPSEQDAIAKAICDIEIINIVQLFITDNTKIPSIDMNTINSTYQALLEEHGIIQQTTDKKRLKSLIQDKIPEADFVKRGPKPELVISKQSKNKLLSELYEESTMDEEVDILSKASKIIRREIDAMEDWQYTGSFDDFETPKRLLQLVRWIVYGQHTSLQVKREKEAEKMSRNLAQHIIASYRSKRQLNYKPKSDATFHKDKITPLTVGLALTSYQANRSRADVETLQHIKASVSYDEVERSTTRIATAVIDDINSNCNGVHMPPFVKKGIRPLFAIDNIDWGSESDPFHGADLMVAQKDVRGKPLLGVDISLDPSNKDRSLNNYPELKYKECQKPSNPKVDHSGYKLYTLKNEGKGYEQINIIWLLMCNWFVSQFIANRVSVQDQEKTDNMEEEIEQDRVGSEMEELQDVVKEPQGERHKIITEDAVAENSQDKLNGTDVEISQGIQEADVQISHSFNEVAEEGGSKNMTENVVDERSQRIQNIEVAVDHRSEEPEVGKPYNVPENGNIEISQKATEKAVERQNLTDGIKTSTTEDNVSKNPKAKKSTIKCPTWSAYHSLINKPNSVWNVGLCAPLYRQSPTEWPVLLTILMQAQKINTVIVGEGCRPVITLDGDLYDRAVKLKDYKHHWCIRLGALHTIIAALKCLGKYIEGSGLDLVWEEAGIYGSAIVRQILDGRHIYRGIEAHTFTLIALYHLIIQVVFTEAEIANLASDIKGAVDAFGSYIKSNDSDVFEYQVETIQQLLHDKDVFKHIDEWRARSSGIQKFLINYMKQVQALLMFIAATRKGDWKLHLATTEALLPYFHAHDQINYGRWVPLYVADMLELQTTDPELWKFFDEGNFIITKNEMPFTGIDPDHAIEQEHKKLKAKGGFVGITGNEAALAKYAIIAPSLARIVQEFKDYAGIEGRQPSTLHPEAVGEKSTKMIKYAANVVNTITKQGNPFQQNDMFNLITYAVTPAEVAKNIEDRDELGRAALEKFVSSRMVEQTTGFWEPQKKNQITFFKNVGPATQAKVKGQLVTIKQERRLLSRLLVVAKSRPEFEVKNAIGEYEFNNVPPSNFHPDGSMVMLSGKSQVVQLIMNLPLPDTVQEDTNVVSSGSTKQILIIDAMCIVNMVTKSNDEKFTAFNFATKFLNIIIDMCNPYDEIRIAFDQYLPGSLKETTRDKRTKKSTSIHYHVNDSTEIRNVKSFLAHIETKAELTEYLADKILSHYKDSTKKVLVMHHTKLIANCNLPDVVSMPEMLNGHHSLEEGDQLVILNAFDVNSKDPAVKLDIFSVDTDVFILLTGCYALLPPSTTLIRKRGERLSISECYQKLGNKKAEALIGWYAFKGTDNTGTFAGKGVSSHFKAFMQCDDTILDAFAVFGLTETLPLWILTEMERYVCLLYSTGSTKSQSVKELRWILFAQNGKEGRQLPPTIGTLKPHTERAFFMALVWKMSCKPYPSIPSPTEFSWKLVDGQLIPIPCTNAPAPEVLLELRRCSCKGSCTTNRCGCRKNNIVCTDACECPDVCENMDNMSAELEDDDELLG